MNKHERPEPSPEDNVVVYPSAFDRREEILAERLLWSSPNGVASYDVAVKFITGEKHGHIKRAKESFEKVVLENGSWFFNNGTRRQLRVWLAHWRKNGMGTINELIELRWLYRKCYRAPVGKAKGPRFDNFDKKDYPLLRAVAREVREAREARKAERHVHGN